MSHLTRFSEPIRSYDFHIYYHHLYEASKNEAIQLKNKIFEEFSEEIDKDELIVKVLRDELIRGPHTVAFFEVDIQNPILFPRLFSWIQYNHGTLSVLVHPNSGDPLKDHTDYASWVGNKLPLITKFLEGPQLVGTYPEFEFPKREVIVGGFYQDPEQYQKSIMIRLIDVGPLDRFWN